MDFAKSEEHLDMERRHKQMEATDRADFAAYCAAAADLELDVPAYLTATRKMALRTIRSAYGPEAWTKAVANMRKSPFCAGRNNRGWKITFDALTKEDTFVKMIEGAFMDSPATKKTVVDLAALAREEPRIWRIRVRNWIEGGKKTWVSKYGPAPGQKGCVVPAEILAEFADKRAAE